MLTRLPMRVLLVACGAVALSLAACGGRTAVPATAPPQHVTPTGAAASVVLRVLIPAPSQGATAHRAFVGASTKGIGVSYGASPASFPAATTPTAAFDVSSGSSICTNNPDGSRSCTLPIEAPSGSDDFHVVAWDAPPTSGSFASAHALSSATVLSQNVQAGHANTLTFTLDGIVDQIALGVSPSSLVAQAPGSTPQTATLSVEAKDAAGDIILDNGSYVDAAGNPLTITIAQSALSTYDRVQTTLSATRVTGPANASITVTYAGNTTLGTTFSATVSGGTIAGASTPATLSIAQPSSGPIFSEFPAPGGPFSIANGPDGNLWFTEMNAVAVGRITTAGSVQSWSIENTPAPMSTPTAMPFAITSGYGNQLFVSDAGNEQEYLIAPPSGSGAPTVTALPGLADAGFAYDAATQTLFGIASGRAYVSGDTNGQWNDGFVTGGALAYLALGPDGNLWVTQSDFDRIIKVTNPQALSGGATIAYTAYAFGPNPPTLQPEGIIAGPDGNMWFAEFGGSAIGVMSTAGTLLHQYATPTANAGPYQLTIGPDGNVWFTESNANRIGRVTPSGQITEYAVGGQPRGIVVGPDNNLWFTEFGSNSVGRFIL